MLEKEVVVSVRHWLESMVINMNLCPFAKRELSQNRVRFTVTEATTEEDLLVSLQAELELLEGEPLIETTLLIHPQVLQDFYDYNQFLNFVDSLLVELKLEGIYQIASFHPHYRFGGTGEDDAENYTNRSPYPLLHILREDSLERAIAETANVEQIPARNIALMNSIGTDKLAELMQACFRPTVKIK